jgi:SAM-dependent methyltransferase
MTEEVACVESPVTAEEIDERGYITANPDVRESGLSATDHFRAVGKAQGRIQAVNIDQILLLRDAKIGKLSFLTKPRIDRHQGQPADFLSAELLEEFSVPDSPPVSAHPYPAAVEQLIRDNPNKLFLDVGAGLRPTYYGNVVNTEIYPSFSTDVLCVGEAMPFTSAQFDFVFCFATLEHTKRPWDVAAEICRVLKPGGTVMIDYPFMQPVHGYPHHYFNATPMGNRSLFEQDCNVQSVEIGWHHHPMIGLQWMMTVFYRGLQPVDARAFGNLRINDVVSAPLDKLLHEDYCKNLHPEMQKVIASGSLLVATKKDNLDRPTQRTDAILAADRSEVSQQDAIHRSRAAADIKIAALMQRNAALLMQQEALLKSTSWRLTSPLRACGRLFYGWSR